MIRPNSLFLSSGRNTPLREASNAAIRTDLSCFLNPLGRNRAAGGRQKKISSRCEYQIQPQRRKSLDTIQPRIRVLIRRSAKSAPTTSNSGEERPDSRQCFRRDASCGGAPRSRYLAKRAQRAMLSLSTAGEPRMGESRTPTQDHHEAASRRLVARSYIPKGRRKRPRLPFIMPLICFIIFRLSPNCLTMRLTSSILRPAPFAMRVFRRMSITSGWVRS